MRRIIAKRLRNEARNRGKDGSVVINREYDRLKKEYKTHTQNPKPKDEKPFLLTNNQVVLKHKQQEAIKNNPKRRPKIKPFQKGLTIMHNSIYYESKNKIKL